MRKERKRNLLPAWVGIYGILVFLAHTVAWQAAFVIKVGLPHFRKLSTIILFQNGMDSSMRALIVAFSTDFYYCLYCPALVLYACPSVRRNCRLLGGFSVTASSKSRKVLKQALFCYLFHIYFLSRCSSRVSPKTKKDSIHPSSSQIPMLNSYSRYICTYNKAVCEIHRQEYISFLINSIIVHRSQIEPEVFSTISRRQNGQFMQWILSSLNYFDALMNTFIIIEIQASFLKVFFLMIRIIFNISITIIPLV